MRHFIGRAGCAVVIGLVSAAVLSAAITHIPAQPNVDQSVSFQLVTTVSAVLTSIRWNFGDGTGASGTKVVTKTYRSPGSFNVECRFRDAFTGRDFIENTIVTVVENRRITYTPAMPQVNQMVSFQAVNFLSASIRWDFGDGTAQVMGGAAIAHVYPTPGSFQVRAWDLAGTSPTAIAASLTVSLDISRRRIVCSSPGPFVRLPATFTAVNFYTSDIRWDFGDGTPPQAGSTSMVHTYATQGDYTVQAWDWGGLYGGPTSLDVTVREAMGPRAAFGVSFLQLRFEDGKSYTVVPKGLPSLRAFADIKYEGTGLLRVQWLVDGAPFGVFITRALNFAADTTVDSGVLPGLPTLMPGMHEVSLRIFDPAVDFTIPVIRYFVSADASIRPQDLAGIRLSLDSAKGLAGLACTLRAEGLEVPSGHYVILSGAVTYELLRPVKFALLRVHLEDRLIDQQFLKDLKPGDKREFQTSILNPSPEPKKIYLTIYNLDGPKPELIYFQKIMLYAPGK
jgi:PKD repeat protein